MPSLLYRELYIQNKSHYLAKHFFLFLLFALISTAIMSSPEEMQQLGLTLAIIYTCLFFINNNYFIIKSDLRDGSLELLLSSTSSMSIILAKYFAICISGILSLSLFFPILILFFNPSTTLAIAFYCCSILVLTLSAALIILIALVQSYFQNNTNFLKVMIMPLIFPSLIISGMVISSPNQMSLLAIMLGINMILIPVILYLAHHLIENIYHI